MMSPSDNLDFALPNLSWGFAQTWNESLDQREDKPLTPRNRIWASELGGSYYDRILKMRGVQPSNPPNARSRRKFDAGNLMEWIVSRILLRAGILLNQQEWISYKYTGLLEVTGKLDFLAGGSPDWTKSLDVLGKFGLPDFFEKAAKTVVEHLHQNYPFGLETIVIEIKSCSGFMFDRYETLGPAKQHELQSFHYLKSKSIREAHIVYISRDDLRILEFCVMNPCDRIEKLYKEDIEIITNFFNSNSTPAKEETIFFDYSIGKFSLNWKVSYSLYLTMAYGFQDPMEYENTCKPKIERWNRVLSRMANGKKTTDDNKIVLEEIRNFCKEKQLNYNDILVSSQSKLKKDEDQNDD